MKIESDIVNLFVFNKHGDDTSSTIEQEHDTTIGAQNPKTKGIQGITSCIFVGASAKKNS
jgi:hypothetical protein